MDSSQTAILIGVVVVIALVAGGVWYWMSTHKKNGFHGHSHCPCGCAAFGCTCPMHCPCRQSYCAHM
jgi:hypothetical protein